MSEIDNLTRIINNFYSALFERGTGGKKFNAVLRYSQQSIETINIIEEDYGIIVNTVPFARAGGPMVVAGADTDVGASQYGITGATQRLQYSSGALYEKQIDRNTKVGWLVIRLKPNWAAVGSIGRDPTILYWFQGAAAYLWVGYDDANDKWFVERRNGTGLTRSLGALAAHTAATDHLIAFWWNDTQVGISIDNAAFTITANDKWVAMPGAPMFDIGTKGGANLQLLDASVYWLAMGTGVLTSTALGTYSGLGNTDPVDMASLPDFAGSKPSMLWKAVTGTPDPHVNYGEGVIAT